MGTYHKSMCHPWAGWLRVSAVVGLLLVLTLGAVGNSPLGITPAQAAPLAAPVGLTLREHLPGPYRMGSPLLKSKHGAAAAKLVTPPQGTIWRVARVAVGLTRRV